MGRGKGSGEREKKKSDNSRSISELNHLPKLLGTRVSKFTGRAVSSGVCMSHGTAPAAGTAPQPGSQSPRCHLCPSACPSAPTPPLCSAVRGPRPRPGHPAHVASLASLWGLRREARSSSSRDGGFSTGPAAVQGSTALRVRWAQSPSSPRQGGGSFFWNEQVLVVWLGCA